jgi:solute carrier family 34 (sodium-dependent phosphate cotransporter)
MDPTTPPDTAVAAKTRSGAGSLFVGALQVMKTGAASLDVLQPGGFLVKNPISTLGLGWLGALLVLSGSPIAATSLTLVAAGENAAGGFTEIQGYTMLTGSRLGAAFVVLLTAVIYALRGGIGARMAPLSTAVMTLLTTAIIYIPAAFLGFAILNAPAFHRLELNFPGQFGDLIDLVYGGFIERIETLPSILVFLGGLGILLVSFKVIDTVMPNLDDRSIEDSRLSWLRKKWPMFGLGCLVALIAMSVSVALTVLVPLVAKGYVKREDILPYIMGANITTLGDTMLAAFAVHSPAAVRIVLAGIISTTLLTLLVLGFAYPQFRRGVWRFQRQMVKSKTRLAAFTAALFAIPIALIVVSGVVG